MCKWSINARFFNSFYRLPTLKVNVNAVGVLDTNKISTIFLKKKKVICITITVYLYPINSRFNSCSSECFKSLILAYH